MEVEEGEKIKFVVADSAAFLRNAKLQEIGESIFTLNEVVAEIKDKATKERLQVLPYQLNFSQPTAEAIKEVTEFSKKTGDYPSLSSTDLKVLALTYMLEVTNCGKEHIKTEPQMSATFVSSRKPLQHPRDIAGFHIPSKHKLTGHRMSRRNWLIWKYRKIFQHSEENTEMSEEEESSTGSDSDSDWITPENLNNVIKKMDSTQNGVSANSNEEKPITVACLTTDFAMQNVLLHMGLHVISLDGMLINRLKNYILRCHACYKTTSVMTKKFCPFCGNETLDRVTVTVNPDGSTQYHLSRRKLPSTRGLKYSLPAPKGGKHGENPILFEDQPIADNRLSKKALQKLNPLEPDYVARDSPFLMNDINSKSAVLGTRTHKGRNRNPNAVTGGKKRGGKKT